ncbi:MAG: hypothetical protein IJT91_02040 [Clostridia bacterium]|nr:hypothetical protein [Clostridia bacterium]
MVYDIAGFMTEMDPIYDMCISRCAKYAAPEGCKAEISMSRSDPLYKSWLEENDRTDDEISEYMFFSEWFYRAVLSKNAFMLHASAIAYNGKAVLFSAPSGLGKSTHTGHWKNVYGDAVVFLNDDKPLISLRENGIFVSGTPFSGKHDISENITVPLHAVCFLYRAREDHIEPISSAEGFRFSWLQTIRNIGPKTSAMMLESVKQYAENTRFYAMGCTDSDHAAEVARNAIFEIG